MAGVLCVEDVEEREHTCVGVGVCVCGGRSNGKMGGSPGREAGRARGRWERTGSGCWQCRGQRTSAADVGEIERGREDDRSA
jgi:hypothetical protein